jgi:hypothetical protein
MPIIKNRFGVGKRNLPNPAPDNKFLYNWDSLKVFRPLEHNLTESVIWCKHLCMYCKGEHYHRIGSYRPCMAPKPVCGICPKCREAIRLKQQLINQGRIA